MHMSPFIVYLKTFMLLLVLTNLTLPASINSEQNCLPEEEMLGIPHCTKREITKCYLAWY